MFQSFRVIKLLVISHSLDFQLLIKSYFEDSGIFCLAVTDVVQATATVVREQPHLILLDIDLPEGGGLLLLDRLRLNDSASKVPIVIITAHITSGLEPKLRSQGAIAFLRKPIEKEVLVDIVRQVLAKPPTP